MLRAPTDLRVSELIDHNRKEWKIELIVELFHPLDSSLILATPIGQYDTEDRLIWHSDSKGKFTVKSAHHLALELSKIEGESLDHLLINCSFARQVWALSYLPWKIISRSYSCLDDWMRSVCSGLSANESDRFLVICWTIWKSRNKLMMEGKTQRALEVILSADRFLFEFKELNTQMAPSTSPQRTEQMWLPPPCEFVKINFDGATFNFQTAMGVGIVARNSEGECLAWRTRCVNHTDDAALAEALAAHEAMRLAIQEGWQSVILEGDCKNIISRLNSNDPDDSVIGPIIDDTRYLKEAIERCRVDFIPRECNSLAHSLARKALDNLDGRNSLPPDLL
ncbi:UNVERIFIED_CONTAM: hypothetical protein Scaly_0688900 [Sesamum calycinum]|uniref:RNase H type-1 domain-containing protein n=1 Tax=Sesamum calycinum TaxID=2727403 RepID=A0AAW2R7A2_9LAMI